MKIAILSDIHDNVWNLNAALEMASEFEALICCGDLCAPFIVDLIALAMPGKPVHIVFGNNDGDPRRITDKTRTYPDVHVHGEFLQDEFAGKRFAVNHYDAIALPIARSEEFDVVCFGHNHRYQVEQFGKTLAINPGTIMGYDGVRRVDIPATFVVYDTALEEVKSYRVISTPENVARSAVLFLG
jgi:putative phosphoesterase